MYRHLEGGTSSSGKMSSSGGGIVFGKAAAAGQNVIGIGIVTGKATQKRTSRTPKML